MNPVRISSASSSLLLSMISSSSLPYFSDNQSLFCFISYVFVHHNCSDYDKDLSLYSRGHHPQNKERAFKILKHLFDDVL